MITEKEEKKLSQTRLYTVLCLQQEDLFWHDSDYTEINGKRYGYFRGIKPWYKVASNLNSVFQVTQEKLF